MEVTKEYMKLAERDNKCLHKVYYKYWEHPRYKILKDFCKDFKTLLSVGSGPKEPVLLGSTHALDICPDAEKYLRLNKWYGSFTLGSCTELPFPDKSFDIVVCSEVIEHLPSIDDVKKAISEIRRVGCKFIITTPNSEILAPATQNPAHKQFFTLASLKEIIDFPCKVYAANEHLFIQT